MIGRRLGAVLLASLVLVSGAAVPALAAENMTTQMAANFDADIAQDPMLTTDVTVATHDRETMDSPLAYEDDQGDLAMLEASVNRSTDVDDIGEGTVNPYKFYATDIWYQDAYAFPHDAANSWSNAADWSTTAGISTANTTTATDVDAVNVSSSGLTDGNSETATFSENVSVESDVNKRYLAAALDVVSVDSGASVYLRAVEDDGDYKQVALVNTSKMASADTVAANSTGEGAVVQQQLGSLDVMGSGDGTLSAVDQLEVVVMDGDATVHIQMLNAEKIGEYHFGEKRVNTDDEDDFETMDYHEPTGELWIHDLDTMGDTFDDATIKGLTFPAMFAASDLSEDRDTDINVSVTTASGYPSFQMLVYQQYRLELPSAYDLSYSNAQLVDTVSMPTNRYQSVGIVEGASDTNFSDLSYTSVKSTYTDASRGDMVVVDDTIQPGQEIAVQVVSLATEQESSMLLDVQMDGGGVFADGGGGGGIWDRIMQPLNWFIGAVTGIFARLGIGRMRA